MASDRTLRAIRQAAELIGKADALLITAGAGMGVDSGLPDFRGKDGFWRAYPALGQRGISFERMAQPSWFVEDPETAWAFYGHRQQLYRETKPHDGFRLLLEWGRAMPAGYFVVTSNVDGQFHFAEFERTRIFEQHGNIHRHQCSVPCCSMIWYYDYPGRSSDPPPDLEIDLTTFTARGRLPRCPECGAVARPNVLMFDDAQFVPEVRRVQQDRYAAWLGSARGGRIVVLELGAGKAVPSIRRHGEDLVARGFGTLVRINPDATDGDDPAIPIRMGALEALEAIEESLPEAFREQVRAAVPAAQSLCLFEEVSGRLPNGANRFVSRDLTTVKYLRMTSDALTVRLANGIEVRVERIDVRRNYLAYNLSVDLPAPGHAAQVIEEARAFVRTQFHGPEPVVVQPKMYDPASTIPILPPLQFAARLISDVAIGEDDHGSWMNLIWFAEIDNEKSIRAYVEEALQRVDWKRQASGFEH